MSAPDPSAFDLGPPDARRAILCLHGLTGTPYEVRPIGEAMAARGFRARGPVVPGHEESPELLSKVKHREWLDGARKELEALVGSHEEVYIAGLSLGGLLSLALLIETPLAGAVVIGTPLRLQAPIPQIIPWARFLVPQLPKRQGSDIQDAEARERHPGFRSMPLASVHQLMQLQGRVLAGLASVQTRILVAHGRLDRTAVPSDAQEIYDTVSSGERALWYGERSGHVLPVDHDGPALVDEIARFLTD